MKKIIPIPKEIKETENRTDEFLKLYFEDLRTNKTFDIFEIIHMKMWNYSEVTVLKTSEPGAFTVRVHDNADLPEDAGRGLFEEQGYCIEIGDNGADVSFINKDGFTNALSTLKQLFEKSESGYYMTCCHIKDWPTVEQRAVSNTFAWYAGYGRLGFDMQLWGYDEWIEYLNICSDLKINQFNMCMYGYWPFEFDAYPETILKNYKMKVWNKESNNWITIEYMHPNLDSAFLGKLIEYGHKLGVSFFAYVGLNSYNGGYSSINKDKRMRLPKDSKYVNDFDCLCLSDEENIAYLKASFRRIVQLGFDGIDFEESEEAFWYCDCDRCKENYLKGANSLEEAKHKANNQLLMTLYDVIRDENPNCKIGLRAWRQPPLEKPAELMQEMVSSVPDDILLFWAPGLYVPEKEFEKWTEAFGKERIWARDTESNAVSSCFGRLIRICRRNGLRCDEESNDQFLEEDIRQHAGSAKLGVKGINGYMFEWYGFFIHLFAHAFYGWGAYLAPDEFYDYAISAVFGEELKDNILYVLMNMFTIHESQLKIFPTEFPFARNKVEKRDLDRINQAIADWPVIMDKLSTIMTALKADDKLNVYLPHFEKLTVASKRNRVIYDLAKASIAYDNASTDEEKRDYLLQMYVLNEKNFDIVKNNYFDVNPVSETGTKSCMIPYHELKRVLTNALYPDQYDDEPIYLGVEALGWLWL